MTTYFPTLLLIAITFATTFFKPFFFEAALNVNLTTMLVMTTIFISKMEGLPPTSDIKMIDIWLVLCQMVPFTEVVLLTAMEYQRDDETTEINLITATATTNEEEEEKTPVKSLKRIIRWLPELKIIGWCFLYSYLHSNYMRIYLLKGETISERNLLPSLVLACFAVYFVLATIFYYDISF